MNDFQQYIYNLLPPDKKQRKSGWIYFNAPCCILSERADTKHRGNIIFSDDGNISYNCFNCHYHFTYINGNPISKNFYEFLKLLNVSDTQIKEAKELIENNVTGNHKSVYIKKKEYKKIPPEYKSVRKSLYSNCKNKYFLKAVEYLSKRNPALIKWTDIYWADKQNNILIPYYENNEQVGYCLRMLQDNIENKYLQFCYTGYMYNIDLLRSERKNIICVEGGIDALAIDGVGLLQNYLTKDRMKTLKYYSQFKNIIILPDNDKAGKILVEQILKENLPFGIAFPDWETTIKDAEDAVKKYGQLYTIHKILNNVEYNPMMIKVKMNQWFKYEDKEKQWNKKIMKN